MSFAIAVSAQVATGGQFSLKQTVVADGGNSMQAGEFQLSGTAGQNVAGQKVAGQSFGVYAGFWLPGDLLPTAAPVSVTGRIMTAAGRPIPGVLVTIIGPDGISRHTLSNSLGYFAFGGVEAGYTYVVTATSRRFRFEQPSLVRNILDGVDDMDFVAWPN